MHNVPNEKITASVMAATDPLSPFWKSDREIDNAIGALRYRRAEEKRQVQAELIQTAKLLCDEDLAIFIHLLLWDCPREVSLATLRKMIGKDATNEQVVAIAGPCKAYTRCIRCGRSYWQDVFSRKELRAKHMNTIDACPDCLSISAETAEVLLKTARARTQKLAAMPYQEYLQTPEWKETRKAALEHAHHRCQICNSSERLNVHHRTYERRGRERSDDLIVLCNSCHALYHGKAKV